MARKKKKDLEIEESDYTNIGIKKETQNGIIAVIFFVIALFFLLSSLGLAGNAGNVVYEKFLRLFFGYGFLLLPIILISIGLLILKTSFPKLGKKHWASAVILLISALGLLDVMFNNAAGGLIGKIGRLFVRWFDVYVSVLLFLAMITISLLVLFETRLRIPDFVKNLWARLSSQSEDDYEEDVNTEVEEEDIEEEEVAEEAEEEAEEEAPKKKSLNIFGIGKKSTEDEDDITITNGGLPSTYVPPPISLLSKSSGKASVGDVKASANLIKRTLQNFGIDVEMDEVSIGPTVTRYALKPAEGVKLSRIVGLQNDLALALAAHPIRIEAPIPGKALVGIEIPNKTKSMIGLGSLVSDSEFQKSGKPLLTCLGKGVTGKSYYANIAKMPHLLIAGATGSGKSVTVHNLIISLLYRNGPQDLRFIMVDPKRVELTLYNKIPHLLTPVIKDPKKAILSLKWAIKEMERRYDVLESESVRDIGSYHSTIVEPAYKEAEKKSDEDDDVTLPERMPYIVIIIDELADLMQSYPRELESSIVRLAQMSRAVGIHLILSTQRPSVNVITGLIKANIPARIALQVSSQIDSRTILDTSGAEKLLGAGDMLYTGSDTGKPERMQSAYISEDEVKNIVKHLTKNAEEDLIDEITLTETSNGADSNIFSATMDEDEDDELYEEAKQTVIEAGKASTSYLQRKLKVGYSRAARLMDILEERGVIGPADGSKPRDILDDDYENNDAGDDNNETYEDENS